MRIALVGTANSGKSTLLKAFLRRWPMYGTPVKTYRDVLVENKFEHSSKTSEEVQLTILDFMMKEQEKYVLGDKIIYDRCSLDNLAYTLQANASNLISDEVTAASISLVRESMKNIDIIFWLKYDPSIRVVDDGLRDTDIEFIKGTDKVFADLFHQYVENLESDIFFPANDCPAMIMVEGKTVDDRIDFVAEFIDIKGELIETENSVLDPANVDMLEQMMEDQKKQGINDDQLKRVIQSFKTPTR